jgi:hypothetical protein
MPYGANIFSTAWVNVSHTNVGSTPLSSTCLFVCKKIVFAPTPWPSRTSVILSPTTIRVLKVDISHPLWLGL